MGNESKANSIQSGNGVCRSKSMKKTRLLSISTVAHQLQILEVCQDWVTPEKNGLIIIKRIIFPKESGF